MSLSRVNVQALRLKVANVINLKGQVRFRKGNILPRFRREFDPPTKSSLYSNPRQSRPPEAEILQRNVLKVKYNQHLSALVQYLHEDHLKDSDVGEAALLESQKEEKEHQRLLLENEAVNAEIAAEREVRLKREMEVKKAEAEARLAEWTEEQARTKERAERIVALEVEELAECIKEDNVEAAIEDALNNEVDHEFAIDTEGHIYRGRFTQSQDVKPEDREKMELNPWFDELLQKRKRF